MTREPMTNAELIQATADTVIGALTAAGTFKPTKPARKRVNWERLLVYEYLSLAYPTVPHWVRIEVGPIPEEQKDAIYGRIRRWADAVVHLPDTNLIIEAKMRAKPDVVAQLINYARLLPMTPLFEKYKELPITLQLVCAMIDDETRKFVEAQGIEVVEFRPSNFEEWYKLVIEKKQPEE